MGLLKPNNKGAIKTWRWSHVLSWNFLSSIKETLLTWICLKILLFLLFQTHEITAQHRTCHQLKWFFDQLIPENNRKISSIEPGIAVEKSGANHNMHSIQTLHKTEHSIKRCCNVSLCCWHIYAAYHFSLINDDVPPPQIVFCRNVILQNPPHLECYFIRNF